MIKKKCKECGTLLNPYAPEYCDVCHGNYGWWFTCDSHQDIIFREELEECPVCEAEKGLKKETSFDAEVTQKSTSMGHSKFRQGKSRENAPPQIEEEIKEHKLIGLGGWLILVGFGIILGPLRISYYLFTIYFPLVYEGTLMGLFEYGSDGYSPPLGLLIGFECVVNIGLLLFGVVLLIKFFNKNYLFKKYFIVYYILTLLFILSDIIIAQAIPETTGYDAESIKELIKQITACVIWVPYMLVSKRVKNTFVRGESKLLIQDLNSY